MVNRGLSRIDPGMLANVCAQRAVTDPDPLQSNLTALERTWQANPARDAEIPSFNFKMILSSSRIVRWEVPMGPLGVLS